MCSSIDARILKHVRTACVSCLQALLAPCNKAGDGIPGKPKEIMYILLAEGVAQELELNCCVMGESFSLCETTHNSMHMHVVALKVYVLVC